MAATRGMADDEGSHHPDGQLQCAATGRPGCGPGQRVFTVRQNNPICSPMKSSPMPAPPAAQIGGTARGWHRQLGHSLQPRVAAGQVHMRRTSAAAASR
jgi:hypothetical protein